MNRSKSFFINTLFNYIFRIGNMVISFFSIPLMLNIMGSERFAIWQTILTIINWANLANFGIGNGLRNKITQSIAKDKYDNIKYYISSAYYFLIKISLVIAILSVILILLLNIKFIFKDTTVNLLEIKIALIIVVFSFSINFVLGLVKSILYGIHKSSLVTIAQFINSIMILLILKFIQISKIDNIKIGVIAIIFLIVTSIVNVILSFFVFKKYVKRPSVKYIDKIYGKELQNTGLRFFILQIATMFLFSIDNFLISSLLGVQAVTPYSIANKLLLLFNTFFSILLIQMWNASGDAFNKNDYKWIEKAIRGLLLALLIMVIGIIIIVRYFNEIIMLWIKNPIYISGLSVKLMGIYVIILMFNGIFVNIENGIGLIKPQIISYVIAGVINIPLTIYFIKYLNMGLNGVLTAKIICILIPSIVCSIHVKKILYNMKHKKGKITND